MVRDSFEAAKKKKGCRWEAEKNCAQCEWLSTMRVEMKPGFSYQTNKSHMEREREREASAVHAGD